MMRALTHSQAEDGLMNSMGYVILFLAVVAFASLGVFMAVLLSEVM
ncbi:hypothetical protein [Methanoculleus frigidifontis]|nr:hypothetical protein [Methanoculleus sp. FWC-SCC1]